MRPTYWDILVRSRELPPGRLLRRNLLLTVICLFVAFTVVGIATARMTRSARITLLGVACDAQYGPGEWYYHCRVPSMAGGCACWKRFDATTDPDQF